MRSNTLTRVSNNPGAVQTTIGGHHFVTDPNQKIYEIQAKILKPPLRRSVIQWFFQYFPRSSGPALSASSST